MKSKLLMMTVLWLCALVSEGQTVFTVGFDEVPEGATNYHSISAALSAVRGGTTYELWVKAGVYKEQELLIPVNVRLYGGFRGDEKKLKERVFDTNLTVLDGQVSHRVVTVKGILDGVTVQNGQTRENGGGVYLHASGVVRNCRIQNNVSGNAGGGVWCNGGGVIRDCKIVANKACGSDYAVGGSSYWEVNNCTVVENTVTMPVSVATLNSPAPLCEGSVLQMDAPVVNSNGLSIVASGWLLGGQPVELPYMVTKADNDKELRYWASTICNTDTTAGVKLVVNPKPTVELALINSPLRSGNAQVHDRISILASSSGIAAWKYSFSTDGGNTFQSVASDYTASSSTSGRTHLPSEAGNYIYRVIVLTGGGCSDTVTSALRVDQLNLSKMQEWEPKGNEAIGTSLALKDARDGKSYQVKLMPDGHWWMTEDLRYGAPVDAATFKINANISSQNQIGAGLWGVCYDNITYSSGYLYNWQAAMQDGEAYNRGMTRKDWNRQWRGICPEGWHIPDNEFEQLTGKLATVTDLTGRDGSNENSWNGMLGGYMTKNGETTDVTVSAYYWTSISLKNRIANSLIAGRNNTLPKGTMRRNSGMLVRCVRNYCDPTLIITAPCDLAACSGKNVDMAVTAEGDGLQYQWYKGDQLLADGKDFSGTKSAFLKMNDLTGDDAGKYICEVKNRCNQITRVYANLAVDNVCETLATTMQEWIPENKDTIGSVLLLKDKRDEKVYRVKKMPDGKWWMIQDLRFGNPVTPEIYMQNSEISAEDKLGEGLYGVCMENRPESSSCDVGYLYNWQAVMQDQDAYTDSPVEKSEWAGTWQGICPVGWHVPSGGPEGEFRALYRSIGGDSDLKATAVNFLGTDDKLKQHWNGVLGGYCYNDGNLFDQGSIGFYWSSSYTSSYNAYRLYINRDKVFPEDSGSKYRGASVRCVKD